MQSPFSRSSLVLLTTWVTLAIISIIRLVRRTPELHHVHAICAASILSFLTIRVATSLLQRTNRRLRRDFLERVTFGVVLAAVAMSDLRRAEAWEDIKRMPLIWYVLGFAWLQQILEAKEAFWSEPDNEEESLGYVGSGRGAPTDGAVVEEVLGDAGGFVDVLTDSLIEMWVSAPGWAILWRDVATMPVIVPAMGVYVVGLGVGAARSVGAGGKRRKVG